MLFLKAILWWWAKIDNIALIRPSWALQSLIMYLKYY